MTRDDTEHGMFYRARRALLLDHCFLGALVMHLEPVVDPKTNGMWVDGRRVGYNPEALEALDLRAAAGLLAKATLHAALRHPLRRAHREAPTWQEACDEVTEPLVLQSSLLLPVGAGGRAEFAELSAEEVYEKLRAEQQQEQVQAEAQAEEDAQGQESGESGGESAPEADGQGNAPAPSCELREAADAGGSPLSEAEASAQEQEWKVNLQQAVKAAEARGELPGFLQRLIDKSLQPVVDWRAELRRHMTAFASQDSSWMRRNRRFADVYLPGVRSERMGELIVVNDTSGSTQWAQARFLSELDAIREEVRPEKTRYVQQDTRVVRDETVEEGEPLPRGVLGGGGTDFRPIFEQLAREGCVPACLVFLTDLDGPFPAQAPEFPVIWAVAGSTREAPFGDIVVIEP